MKTDPRGNSFDGGAMMHDISNMDQSQLDRYVRASFLGRPDRTLPGPFWGTYYDPSSLGESDGRSAPSSARLFADLYVSLGNKQRRGETSIKVRNQGEILEYTPDFEYRGRLRVSLGQILDESIATPEPTKETLRLGVFAFTTVDAMAGQDGPDSFVQQFGAKLAEKGQMNMGEVQEVFQEIKPKTAPELDNLIAKARDLMDIPVFRETLERVNAVYGNLYQLPELDTTEFPSN